MKTLRTIGFVFFAGIGVFYVCLFSLGPTILKYKIEEAAASNGFEVRFDSPSISSFVVDGVTATIHNVEVFYLSSDSLPRLAKIDALSLDVPLWKGAKPQVCISKGVFTFVEDASGQRNFPISFEEPTRKALLASVIVDSCLVHIEVVDHVFEQVLNGQLVGLKKGVNVSLAADHISHSNGGIKDYVNREGDYNGVVSFDDGELLFTDFTIECSGIKGLINSKRGGYQVHASSDFVNWLYLLPEDYLPQFEQLDNQGQCELSFFWKMGKIRELELSTNGEVVLRNIESEQSLVLDLSGLSRKRETVLAIEVSGDVGESKLTVNAGDLVENEVQLVADVSIDLKSLFEVLYGQTMQATGSLRIGGTIDHQKRVMDLNGILDDFTLKKRGQVVLEHDLNLILSNERLSIVSSFSNEEVNNFKGQLVVDDISNFLLLNQRPVQGRFVVQAASYGKLKDSTFEALDFEGSFALVPSKSYVHLLGIPFDPLKTPSYFKLSKGTFVGLDGEKVEVNYRYEDDDEVLHNDFSFTKTGKSSVLKFSSKKPTNLAFIMIEDQTVSFYGAFHHFNSQELAATFGGDWEDVNDLDGYFTGRLIYSPIDLVTGVFNDVVFEEMDVHVTLSGKRVQFKGGFAVTPTGVEKAENFDLGANELGFMELVDHVFH